MIYWPLSYVIIYRSYTLLKNVRFYWATLYIFYWATLYIHKEYLYSTLINKKSLSTDMNHGWWKSSAHKSSRHLFSEPQRQAYYSPHQLISKCKDHTHSTLVIFLVKMHQISVAKLPTVARHVICSDLKNTQLPTKAALHSMLYDTCYYKNDNFNTNHNPVLFYILT